MRDAAAESGKPQVNRPPAAGKRAGFHPTTLLVVWFSLLLVGQSLAGWHILLTLLLLSACGAGVRQDWKRLAWGSRWLIVSLFAVFAWGEAGEAVCPSALAPTLEGLSLALTQVGRLLLVLMAVAILRYGMPLADLLRGLHGLLQPIRRWRIDTDRVVVRLILVLRQADQMPPSWRDWRSLLAPHEHVAGGEVIELADKPLSYRDYLAILLVCGLVAVFLAQRM
ncbi:MAG: hypothetical protein RKP46_16915 [Candidatus Accumulibacter sp.]|uniref:hypothetical protein n=1 Tax=Accumulibacter sp. TaxID=2053492 RepID=UPI00287967F7|nr:hypothetical protein [Accumulibacter sp.]MDS4016012.1 hypothetical protein [Accumulibacter sp.]